MRTFRWGDGFGGVGVESSGHPRSPSSLVDLDLVFHFLLQVLEFPGDGGTCPRPVAFRDDHVGVVAGLAQLNALTLRGS